MDDGSVDGTKQVAFDYVKKYKVDNVRVLLLGRNHGKGEAIRQVRQFWLFVNFCLKFQLVLNAVEESLPYEGQ